MTRDNHYQSITPNSSNSSLNESKLSSCSGSLKEENKSQSRHYYFDDEEKIMKCKVSPDVDETRVK